MGLGAQAWPGRVHAEGGVCRGRERAGEGARGRAPDPVPVHECRRRARPTPRGGPRPRARVAGAPAARAAVRGGTRGPAAVLLLPRDGPWLPLETDFSGERDSFLRKGLGGRGPSQACPQEASIPRAHLPSLPEPEMRPPMAARGSPRSRLPIGSEMWAGPPCPATAISSTPMPCK